MHTITKYLVASTMALAAHAHAFSFSFTEAALKALASGQQSSKAPRYGTPQAADIELPNATGNFGACRENFANGEPPRIESHGRNRLRALCFNGFAVLHSGDYKTPVYSAVVLNAKRVNAARENARTDFFFEDARIPGNERARLDDYKFSGFDRGHASPAAEMPDERSMAQSFSLSNMVPQAPENNRKAWANIEKATRKYASRATGSVYVITGTVHQAESCPIVVGAREILQANGISTVGIENNQVVAAARKFGYKTPRTYDLSQCSIGSGVVVPSHLYKLVYDPSANRAWVHWLANTDSAKPTRPISYRELVQRTGIEFLPGLTPNS